MKQKNNLEPDNQQSLIEDLTITQDRAEEVKGGNGVLNPPWGIDRIDQRARI
jgi:hypothetical protein